MADGGPPAHKPVAGALTALPLTQSQCRFFADLAQRVSRLKIDPTKSDFLRHRLTRRIRALGLSGFDAYEALLRGDPCGPELRSFIEALTTHTTSFFREKHQYDWLEAEGITRLSDDGAGLARPLTVWSAACSTGAELWSAGMILADRAAADRAMRRFELMGTDISRTVLKKAESATYPEAEIAGVSAVHRARYLMRSREVHGAVGGHLYRITPELRRLGRFAAANLTEAGTLPQWTADIVFLRNVLIYFEPAMQAQAVDAVVGRLRRGGFLLTGHAEALPAHPALRGIGPSIYRKE